VGPSERRGLEKARDSAQDVEMPVLGDGRLCEGDDSPKDLECGKEEGGAIESVQGRNPGGSRTYNRDLVCKVIKGIWPRTSGRSAETNLGGGGRLTCGVIRHLVVVQFIPIRIQILP
jgi:hypothetical protein